MSNNLEVQWHAWVSWEARYHLQLRGHSISDNGMAPYTRPPMIRSSRETALLAARGAVAEVVAQHRDAHAVEAVVYRVVVDSSSGRIVARDQRYTVTSEGEFATTQHNGARQAPMLADPAVQP